MGSPMLDKKADRKTAANGRRDQGEFEGGGPVAPTVCRHRVALETDRVRVWIIRASDPANGSASTRHVLDYFWTSVNGGRGRQHLMDGTTVEHTYFPGETRHETYGPDSSRSNDSKISAARR